MTRANGRIPCPRCGQARAWLARDGWLLCNRRNACGFRGRPDGATVLGGPSSSRKPRLDAAEVRAFWESTADLDIDREACALLDAKGSDPAILSRLGLVRVVRPSVRPRFAWWPSHRPDWAAHRIVTRGFDARGVAVNVHARSVRRVDSPKTRWARGRDASGLLFADALGEALLGGLERARRVSAVFIAEGLTDFARAVCWAQRTGREARGLAIFGLVAGSAPALAAARLPDVPIFVATDDDAAGARYARAVRCALSGHRVARVVIGGAS
jgi:hypothetical protein